MTTVTTSEGDSGVHALRLLGATALACASIPLVGVGPASADTAVKAPTNYGYFNATGIDKPEQSPADPPNVTSEYADGVGPGHLGVAASGGQETKVSFLLFDVFDLDPLSTVSKAVLRVPTVPDSPPEDFSYQASPDKVAVCKAGSEGFAEDDGNGTMLAPTRLCDAFKAVGKASKDGKAYEFDVTKLVATWLSGDNDGLALTVADTAQSSNFQVVFDKAAAASLSLTYTPSVPTVVAPPVAAPPVDSGIVTAPLPDTGGFAPAPDLGTPLAPVEAPALVPTPTLNQPPVAAPAPQQPSVLPVAAVTPSMRPQTGFWVTGLVLAAALALLSLVLGDTSVPVAGSSRSRLSQALSGRRAPSALRTRAA